MENMLDRPDDKDNIFSPNPQAGLPHKVVAKNWDMLEHNQDLQNKQDEQEIDLVCEDPQASTSLSQESTFCKLNEWNTKMRLQMKELGADHIDWMEKINNIVQKINTTENTVESLLNEVISLESQTENLEDHNLDPDQEAKIEEKIMEIRKQLREVNNKLAQVDACNEAHELKEKLLERIENFYKEMALLNTKLGVFHMQERERDSYSSEEMDVERTEPLLPEASPPPPGQNSTPRVAVWKRVLRIFLVFYVLTFTGLSCYILLFDATFIFERVLPSMLGRCRMWELRERIMPFLNLEVEDLLPS